LTPKIKPVNPGFCPLSNPDLRVWKWPGLPGFSGTRVAFPSFGACAIPHLFFCSSTSASNLDLCSGFHRISHLDKKCKLSATARVNWIHLITCKHSVQFYRLWSTLEDNMFDTQFLLLLTMTWVIALHISWPNNSTWRWLGLRTAYKQVHCIINSKERMHHRSSTYSTICPVLTLSGRPLHFLPHCETLILIRGFLQFCTFLFSCYIAAYTGRTDGRTERQTKCIMQDCHIIHAYCSKVSSINCRLKKLTSN